MSRLSQFLSIQFRRCEQRLAQIRDTPHAIAGGVAIGVLFGFTPLWGLKTLLAVFVAWLFRCSKLSSALAVTFHDILLPVWPVILRWQFQIGFWLLSRPHRLPTKFSLKAFHVENFHLFSWKTIRVLWPTFIGSIVLGAPVALIMYFIVFEFVKRTHARKKRDAAPA